MTENGIVNFTATTFGSVATYTCDVGFTLDTGGQEFDRSCVVAAGGTGTWSLNTPTCSREHLKNNSTHQIILVTICKVKALLVTTVEPPIKDPPRKGQPPYKGQSSGPPFL